MLKRKVIFISYLTGINLPMHQSIVHFSLHTSFRKMDLTLKILMLFVHVGLVCCNYRVCIDQEVVSDVGHCSTILDTIDALKYLKLNVTNTVFSIMSAVTPLSVELRFNDLVNVTIEGHVSKTTVTCNSIHSGFYFSGIHGLTIKNLVFAGCGAIQKSTTTDLVSDGKNVTAYFKTALYIWKSSDVSIVNVDIIDSGGLGLAIFDTGKTVWISNSTFKRNVMRVLDGDTVHMGGGGVYIEYTACPPGVVYGTCGAHNSVSGSQYRIEHSMFESNRASLLYPEKSSFVKLVGVKNLTNFQGLSRGGGLAINIHGNASNNFISVVKCKFYSNQAVSGGGLFTRIMDEASNNSIEFVDCEIFNNTSNQNAGGVNIGYLLTSIQRNNISFEHCVIKENHSKTGGGTMLLFNNLGNHLNGCNLIMFTNCQWISNTAEYGAAIDSTVYALYGLGNNPTRFDKCTFYRNRAIETTTDLGLGTQVLSGRGIVKLTNMVIMFCHHVHFENNTGTALWAVASKVHFSCHTTGVFIRNRGINGGAISLMSSSILFVHDNTLLKFIENRAASRGGAIFVHSVHENSFLLSVSTCPLQYTGDLSMKMRNVSIVFDRNVASLDSNSDANSGNSIYVTSLHACVFFCTVNTSAELTIGNYFSCLGNVTFHSCESCTREVEVATRGHHFTITEPMLESSTLLAVPGRVVHLPISVLDDLNNVVDSVYRVQVLNSQETVIDPAYDYTSNGEIKLYGPPQETGTLHIELVGLHEMSLTVNLTLVECPPGFYMEKGSVQASHSSMNIKHCTCNWKRSSVSAYKGIVCDQMSSSANLIHGYWAGYLNNTASPRFFVTAHCPIHFCSYNNSNFKPFYKLPIVASLSSMDKYMCGQSRTGILCSKCTHGHSVHYHSKQFQCKTNRLCKVGWLFYILSELCPITLLFIAIIIFNISFTSGALNGFIFFAQVVDSLALNAFDISGVYSNKLVTVLTKIHEFIYTIFNLEFFNISSLSFCLWKGAGTMDVLIFKLVSIVYAMLLITSTILIIKRCNCRLQYIKTNKSQSYIIHGLSAFLISCYVQCARISFTILNPIYLQQVGHRWDEKVVLYSGNIRYFSIDHLLYAVPALFVICTILVFPPLLLVWYPTGRKLLSRCHLSESKIVQLVEKVLMIDRMKPLLDSFQSTFKDEWRLFAGLFFIYRILALATFTIARTLPQFYTAVEIEVVIITAVHAAVQPYQKTWHNIVDIFILLDIAIINALSMYIYVKATDLDQAVQDSGFISTAIIIRLLLIYLPLVYIAIYLSVLICKQLTVRMFKKRNGSRETTVPDNELPARLLYPNEYMPFDEIRQP